MDAGSESVFHSGPASRWLRHLNKNPYRSPRPLAAGSFIFLIRFQGLNMKANNGLRSIFIIFWVIGSIFWIMLGALDGNFIRSLIYIGIGWVIIFTYISVKDSMNQKK